MRASAGLSSFRSRTRLEQRLEDAKTHLEALKAQSDDEPALSAQQRAGRERAARERQEKIEKALEQMAELEEAKAKEQKRKGRMNISPARVSTTDPEARKMKMANGGFDPAYNVQIAADPDSRAIVAIDVTNHGTDHGEDAPLREQIKQRTGRKVEEHLLDGGYVKLDNIEAASDVAIHAPLPATGKGGSVCIHNPKDTPAMAAWRTRMQTPEGQHAYKQRAATSETVNGDLKTHRGLDRFTVRGLSKVRCVALWSALAYNVLYFAEALVKQT